jgi:hypothetical protein
MCQAAHSAQLAVFRQNFVFHSIYGQYLHFEASPGFFYDLFREFSLSVEFAVVGDAFIRVARAPLTKSSAAV